MGSNGELSFLIPAFGSPDFVIDSAGLSLTVTDVDLSNLNPVPFPGAV